MPGVCARCTARKDIDLGGKECYHHRHGNYCQSEIGNGGWSVATKKNAVNPIPPIPPIGYVIMYQTSMLLGYIKNISSTSHPHLTHISP